MIFFSWSHRKLLIVEVMIHSVFFIFEENINLIFQFLVHHSKLLKDLESSLSRHFFKLSFTIQSSIIKLQLLNSCKCNRFRLDFNCRIQEAVVVFLNISFLAVYEDSTVSMLRAFILWPRLDSSNPYIANGKENEENH